MRKDKARYLGRKKSGKTNGPRLKIPWRLMPKTFFPMARIMDRNTTVFVGRKKKTSSRKNTPNKDQAGGDFLICGLCKGGERTKKEKSIREFIFRRPIKDLHEGSGPAPVKGANCEKGGQEMISCFGEGKQVK